MADTSDDYHFAEDYSLAPLEDDCRLLGTLLDDTLKIDAGEELTAKIEHVRALSQSAFTMEQAGDAETSEVLYKKLDKVICDMPLEEALPLIRACAHYLNLTSIAETHHRVRTYRNKTKWSKSCDEVFKALLIQGLEPDDLYQAVLDLKVEVVLTAHPTQVNRRTLQFKHNRIAAFLERNDRVDLSVEEKEALIEDMVREITSLWQTDELRRRQPTPVDEARGGLHVVEQSLWHAVPAFLRKLNHNLKEHTGQPLPLHTVPVRFGSWMGGDRDGNPNVTAKVTHSVSYLARWMAADMYIREVDQLRFELSLSRCSEELATYAADIEAEIERNAGHGHVGHAGPAPPTVNPGETAEEQLPPGMVVGTMPQTSEFGSEFAETPHFYNELPYIETYADDGNSTPGQATASPQMAPSSPMSGTTPPRTSLDEKPNANGKAAPSVSAAAVSAAALKKGMQKKNKSSVDLLLNPRKTGVTPYRIVLGDVRQKLVHTRQRMADLLAGNQPNDDDTYYESITEFIEPLMVMHRSLEDCHAAVLADGHLSDLIRRAYCFGFTLLKLDLRQESERHTEAMDAVTSYLGLGGYGQWEESKRIEFLLAELKGRRPLIPPSLQVSDNVREVLDTFRMAAQLGSDSLGAYIISMSTAASDVLLVELLQRELRHSIAGEMGKPCPGTTLRVVPLFETLKDLQNGPGILRRLFSMPWYREHIRANHDNHQEVMLGYSDSGKDAGRLAAAWALHQCQEDIVNVSKEFDVKITLFHGRGGSIGRGGGPMHAAIQSQAPGSVRGSLRTTEQGEMVQAKFGLPAIAVRQLEIYVTAVLLATVSPPNPPRCDTWAPLMTRMSELSCADYRGLVFQNEAFIKYFQEATPEEELGNLNIGSRPTRRKKTAGVQHLRAIPWIFAWTQTRSALPSWLGIGYALQKMIDDGHLEALREMYNEWPFFKSMIDLVEMVLIKVDMRVAKRYETVLCTTEESRAIGDLLRAKYDETQRCVLAITNHTQLMEHNYVLKKLILNRNPYVNVMNTLQVEILRRLRADSTHPRLRDALLVSINGIAAGLRNTG